MKIKSFKINLSDKFNLDLPTIDEKKSAIFIFSAPEIHLHKSNYETILKKYPNTPIIGCSTSGEIYQSNVFDDSMSVAICEFQNSEVSFVKMNVSEPEKSYEVGYALGNKLNEKKGLKAIFVLSDGLKVNGSDLSFGINQAAPNVICTGGLAGDHEKFQNTWTIDSNELSQGHVLALGLYGDNLIYAHGSQGGWDIFGPERTITKSHNNIIYEIDGKPALDLYENYLGEMASQLPASALLFPLQIRKNSNDPDRLVRSIVGIDRETKSLIFAGNVPKGYLAQLMKTNFDRIIDAAGDAATIANVEKIKFKGDVLSIAISCVGRRLVLGERTEEETEAILSKLPTGVHQVGYYSYGEISPLVKGKSCELHNQTMTVTVIGERDAA